MTQLQAFAVTLILLALATYVSRKYLTGGQQATLGITATAAHLV